MTTQQSDRFRLMTFNIGGGREVHGPDLVPALEVINDVQPDILVVQEATDYVDASGVCFSIPEQIARRGGFGDNYFFGPTLSLSEHLHVSRAVLVDGLFGDFQDWRHGNAVFCRSGFTRLGDPRESGVPRNVPIFRPAQYGGTRDTDPRCAVLARIDRAPLFPFVIGVHLTTLLGERGSSEVRGRAEQAEIMRLGQTRRLLDLARKHLLEAGELVFLLGDFNAIATESCIASVLEGEGGFLRLRPTGGPSATYAEVPSAIDHIFVHPARRVVDYTCWTVNSAAARRTSDHLPVVADVIVR
jgi:endonuclease/exonuclease/phosphatase family metal-dependent hydrolase